VNPIHDHNRAAWDARVQGGKRFTVAATNEEMERPLEILDPLGWLGGDIIDKRILCLGAGGGRHGPMLAQAGARVTVVDISPEMLRLDTELAEAKGLQVETIETSIDDLSMLPEAAYEAVMQPVSTCYVPDIRLAYHELARVMMPGGVYISRHKQPTNLQVDLAPTPQGFLIDSPYYLDGPLSPAKRPGPHREQGTMEFLHQWGDLLGGLCESGFVIEAVTEPKFSDPSAQPGSFEYRCQFIAPYIQLRARRTDQPVEKSELWVP
jgi:SAM-dependent methyltransferase